MGAGKTKILGIFGGISPKIPKFRGGDGGKNLRDFYHTSADMSLWFKPLFQQLREVRKEVMSKILFSEDFDYVDSLVGEVEGGENLVPDQA